MAPLSDRTWQADTSYRFGFNGKETDAETDLQDYGMRIYNSRQGRFLSVDPLCRSFPWWSPYHFAGNTPIFAIDLDGLEILLAPTPPIVMPRPIIGPIEIPFPTAPVELMPPIPVGPMMPPDITVGQPKVEMAQNPPIEIDWANLPPSSPSDLSGDWEEATDPRNTSGSKDYRNKKTGEQIRWDPRKQGEQGYKGRDHWHRLNPNRTDKGNEYLDKNGDPVSRGSDASHIPATRMIIAPEAKVKPQAEPVTQPQQNDRGFFERVWDNIVDFFTSDNPPSHKNDPNWS